MEKRDFLKSMGLLTAGGVAVSSLVPGAVSAMNIESATFKKDVGLQIYSLGRELNEDVPTGLKKISKMGYNTIYLTGLVMLKLH